MRGQLTELLPEIELIKDSNLRDGVVRAYEEALRRGGWQPQDMKRIPFTLLIKPCPVSYLEHTRGVTKTALGMGTAMAETYGSRMAPDMDVLTAGALLHDVGKLLEYEEEAGQFRKSPSGKALRHPISGTTLAAEVGLPLAVQHAIATHSHEGDGWRATTEAIIIHHADFANFEPLK